MKLTIELTLDNAAVGLDANFEVTRLLHKLAEEVSSGLPFVEVGAVGSVSNYHGDRVGHWEVKE